MMAIRTEHAGAKNGGGVGVSGPRRKAAAVAFGEKKIERRFAWERASSISFRSTK
jgi:hypothetical protein